MKLVRYGEKGSEKPGAIDGDGKVRDLSGLVADIGPGVFEPGVLEQLKGLDLSTLAVLPPGQRYGACLASTPNFHAIGLNYSKHAAESGAQPPKEPILFSKATSVLSGPFDDVVIPKGSEKTDWEVELGVVIGKRASYVAEADALAHVAGYCVVNDLSERAFQIERGGQWIKGKSAPTFGPIGPWLVTADEVGDPQRLGLWLELNGTRVQDGNTSDMIFGVATLVAYMSQFMALLPGDIITTGTPHGVGMGMKPPRYLRPGDRMRLGVDGLGEQQQTAIAYGG